MAIVALHGWHGVITGHVLIDDEDLPAVSTYRWNLGSKGYVIRTDRTGGHKRTIRLHRWLMGLEPGDPRQVDHRNGDPLDCRRENMRVVTGAENAQNRTRSSGRSQYRGVAYKEACRSRPWVAVARIDGRFRHLGYFATEEEAARVASAARRRAMPASEEGRWTT